MKLTLTKDTIISLYNYKNKLKTDNSTILSEFLTMFDTDMVKYINGDVIRNWDNILLIVFFKNDKLTVENIYDIIFKDNPQTNPILFKQNISNRLTGWFRLGILGRKRIITNDKRMAFVYTVNGENIDVQETRKSNIIRTFFKNNEIIYFSDLLQIVLNSYEHNHTGYGADMNHLKRNLKSHISEICKTDGIKLTILNKNIWKQNEFKKTK